MSIAEQIKCKAHPNQYITNYCCKETCFAQLCATCICEHTQFHNRSNTRPEYQNIKQTFLKTNESLNKFKQSLTKQKSRIKSIMEGIQKKRKEVQKMFKQAKQDVMTLVQRTFVELQRDYNQQLVRQKQKTGLLNEAKLDQILAQINKRSLQVYTISQQLNNMRQISNIKKINTEFLPKSVEFKNIICQEICSNQLFQPNVTYKSAHLEEVSGAVKRLISVSFSYPVNGDFRPIRNSASKTPMKDHSQNQQPQPLNFVMNGIPRASFVHSKNPSQLKSPKKHQQFNRGHNMRSTNKQNYWVKPEVQIRFTHTNQF